MKKGIFTSILILFFVIVLAVIISDRKIANQIVVSVEDIYDDVTGKSEDVSNIEEIKINELQPKTTSFYYSTLNENQKKIYNSIVIAIKNLDNKAKIKDYEYTSDDVTMRDVKVAIQNLFLDHPEVFYVNNDYTVSTIDLVNSKRIEVELSYLVNDKKDLSNKIAEINETLEPIVLQASTMDTFDAELYIHDKICEIATYYKYNDINEVPETCHSIYGCFVSKQAVCDGLSKALMIALDKVGIENILVTGTLQSQAHAWNLIKLDNNWYHVDITSDKSVKSGENNKEEIIHSYFNITTEQIKKTNTIDLEDTLPVANTDRYNYYVKTGKYIDITDNFLKKFNNILDNNKNESLVEFAVNPSIKSVPEKMVYTFQDNKYHKYVDTSANKFNYYNILNTYILLINRR